MILDNDFLNLTTWWPNFVFWVARYHHHYLWKGKKPDQKQTSIPENQNIIFAKYFLVLFLNFVEKILKIQKQEKTHKHSRLSSIDNFHFSSHLPPSFPLSNTPTTKKTSKEKKFFKTEFH